MELTRIEEFAKIRPAERRSPTCIWRAASRRPRPATPTPTTISASPISTGSHGVASDLVEAHKWFNLAAAAGHEEAAWCRADISDEMTAREIAEAQRRAREWLAAETRRAA